MVTLILAHASHEASAQEVRGTLFDGTTMEPIAGATMSLLDSAMVFVDRVVTNDSGVFVLRADEPGSFFVRGEQLGYRMKTDGILEIASGGRVQIGFYLWPEPVELDSLQVAVRDTTADLVPWLELNDFYKRMDEGFGYFVTPEDIRRRMPNRLDQLFQAMAGVTAETPFGGGLRIRVRNCSHATILVDGLPLSSMPHIDDIEAVEVYMGISTIPLMYADDDRCGLVLMWTKH